MNTDTILRRLENSGFYGLRADAEFVYAEDPACVLRSFETFIDFAWVAVAILTAVMLFGWAVSLLRGAKNDFFSNIKNLILIFGVLTISKPILNLVYGDNLFAQGCRTIQIPIKDIHAILEKQGANFQDSGVQEQYETIEIYDSGINNTNNQFTPDIQSTEPNINSVNNLPNTAQESGKDVIYTMPNGEKIKKSGGYRSWRNNNPGNIRYSEFSRRVGAIGQAGGFAVFPTEEIGMYAIEALLRSDSYNKLTVAGAITRYAPPSENNTSAYHRQIEKLTGLSINMRMADLTPEQLTDVANAIKTIEGWKVGITQRI